MRYNHVGSQIDQIFCEHSHPVWIIGSPTKFDPEIAAVSPP
jgi:hypothetical protein